MYGMYFIAIICFTFNSVSSKTLNNHIIKLVHKQREKVINDFHNKQLLKIIHLDNYDIIFWRNRSSLQHHVSLVGSAYGYSFLPTESLTFTFNISDTDIYFDYKMLKKETRNLNKAVRIATLNWNKPFSLTDSVCFKENCYNNPEKPKSTASNLFSGLTHFQPVEITNFNVGSQVGLVEALLYIDKFVEIDGPILLKVDVNLYYRFFKVSYNINIVTNKQRWHKQNITFTNYFQHVSFSV